MRDHTIHPVDQYGRPHPIHRHALERGRELHGRGHEGGRGHHGDHDRRSRHLRESLRFQVRRGAVRDALLRLLAEQPMHGYQLMQELADRTGGRWRPSAGSIYPTLQQLEDEGLIVAREQDGRRVFDLTDAGRAAVSGLDDDSPWAGRDAGPNLRGLVRDVSFATMQVARVGSSEATDRAATILTDARRDLYRLLSEDAPETHAETDSPAEAQTDTTPS
jgi:hypothetical protein